MKNNKIPLLIVTSLMLSIVAFGCVSPDATTPKPATQNPPLNLNGVSVHTTAPTTSASIPPDSATVIAKPPAASTTVPPPSSTADVAPTITTFVGIPIVPVPENPNKMVIRQATFNPKTLTVKKGTQVEFGNLDHYNYIIISEGLFNTILLSEDSFFYIFYNAGTYDVWIDSTQGIKLEGTVIVTE